MPRLLMLPLKDRPVPDAAGTKMLMVVSPSGTV